MKKTHAGEEFQFPESWGLSGQQDCVLGSLVDEAGSYVKPGDLCRALYDEDFEAQPAPAKLRVLVQRCRNILDERTKGRVSIEVRRNSGWRITRAHKSILAKIVAKA